VKAGFNGWGLGRGGLEKPQGGSMGRVFLRKKKNESLTVGKAACRTLSVAQFQEKTGERTGRQDKKGASGKSQEI